MNFECGKPANLALLALVKHLLTFITQLKDGNLKNQMHFMIEQNLLFRLKHLLKPYLQLILSTATFCKSEAQKVLDDDSSKILLFFTSSAFSLSRHYMTLSYTYTTTELQLLEKGVVKSWLGPLRP